MHYYKSVAFWRRMWQEFYLCRIFICFFLG